MSKVRVVVYQLKKKVNPTSWGVAARRCDGVECKRHFETREDAETFAKLLKTNAWDDMLWTTRESPRRDRIWARLAKNVVK
jgi:hypothetical protein